MKIVRFANLLLISAFILTNSCKDPDDDDNGGGSPTVYYRVVEWISYDDYQEEEKAVTTYVDNKINLIMGYEYQTKGEWVEDWKYEMNYPEQNTIVTDHLSKVNDIWELEYTDVMSYDNSKLIEIVSYYNDLGTLTPVYRETFDYNNNLLVQNTEYIEDEGGWYAIYRSDYEYDGSALQKIYFYEHEGDVWDPSEMLAYKYQGGAIDLVYYLDYNAGINDWDTTVEIGLEYAGGLLSKAKFMNHDMGVWYHFMDVNYQYDSHGNILSWDEISIVNGFSWKVQFAYEEGLGNFRQVFNHEAQGIWDACRPFPTKSSNSGVSRTKGFDYMIFKN